MRRASSSVFAVLIMAALFWGNCFSCPQVLLALKSHQCCHRTKAKTTASGCQTQALKHFVKAEPADQAPAVVAVVDVPQLSVVALSEPLRAPLQVEHAPPDLLSLHSFYRI